MIKNNNKNIILYIFTIAFWGVFYCFLPFAGDDWAWGSDIGMKRLANAFDGYNGRYVGNLLIILVTRSAAARIIICSLVMFLLIFILAKIFDGMLKKSSGANYIIAFSSVLVLVLPNQIAFGELQPFQIFGSTVGWLSGFTNYVVPSVLILVYYYFVTSKKHDGIPVCILLAADGIIACLCVEHYTLFCLVFSFAVVAYRFWFNKRLCKKSVSFLAGSFVGALIMFTNSSYRLMQMGDVKENQRAVGFIGSLKQYPTYVFGENANRALVIAFEIVLLAGILAFFIFFAKKVIIALKNRSLANLLPIICMVVMTAPLLFTNSGKEIYIVAPRCYFLQYFMLVIFAYGKLANKSKVQSTNKWLKLGFAALLIVTCAVYCRLDYMGYVRDNTVNTALEKGYSTVEVIQYPKSIEHIQWSSNFIEKKTYLKRYKKFKHIPQEKDVKLISYK